MPDVGFGGTSGSTTSYTDNYVYSNGIGLPTGRAMKSGNTSVIITALLGYANGRGAARTCVLSLGSSATGSFGIGAAGSANSTGWVGSSGWLVNGGSAQFIQDFNGSSYFGRSIGGTNTYDSYGTGWTGTLGGAYRYVEAPTAPQNLVIATTTTPGQLQVNFDAPADNGGTGVNGYRIFYWENGVESADAHYVDVLGSGSILSLTPGKTYAVRVSAKNWVTDSAGDVGVTTATSTLFLPAGGTIWDAGTASWKPLIWRQWEQATTSWKVLILKMWDAATTTWKNVN